MTDDELRRAAERVHQEIMNLKCVAPASEHAHGAYKRGHRDARHAAAERAIQILAENPSDGVAAMRDDA